MSNKLTKFFQARSQTPERPVSNATLLNTIREMASENYRADIPEILKPMTPINHATIPYTSYEVHQNEFFDILINKIGPTLVKALLFDNPLGIFRTENFNFGETLEEIYVGLADAEPFDAKSNDSPFKYSDTDIMVFYHDLMHERKYTRTIDKQWTMKAFRSDTSFDSFIDKMFASIISSDELDEFETLKALIPKSLTPVDIGNGVIVSTPATEIDVTLPDWIITFNKELIKRSNLFATPSKTRFENAAGVPQATPKEEQYLIINAALSAELDSLYANAFNMDKATVLATKIVVDEFPQYAGTGALNGALPIAALVSKDTIILKDKLLKMTNIFNPSTLSYNYFLHHHELISYSLLENAHIYYTMPATP